MYDISYFLWVIDDVNFIGFVEGYGVYLYLWIWRCVLFEVEGIFVLCLFVDVGGKFEYLVCLK